MFNRQTLLFRCFVVLLLLISPVGALEGDGVDRNHPVRVHATHFFQNERRAGVGFTIRQ